MKNLRDMSIKEIMNELKNVNVHSSDISIFINSTEKSKEIRNKINQNTNLLYRLLQENEEYVNKEKFLLVILYRLQENLALRNQDSLAQMKLMNTINTAKKMLKDSKTNIAIFNNKKELEIINLDILEGKKISRKNSDRLKEFAKEIPLNFIASSIYLSDLENLICSDSQIGKQLAIYSNFKTLSKGLDTQSILDKKKTDNYMKTTEYKKNIVLALKETLEDYAEHISVDKLLMTAVYRNLDYLDAHSDRKETNNDKQEILKKICDFINDKTKLKGKMTIMYPNNDEKIGEDAEVSCTIKELKEKIQNNFINGQYIGYKTIQRIRNQIFNENVPLEIYDPRIIHLLGINTNELMTLIKSDDNFKCLLDFEIIDDKKLHYILSQKEDISSDMIEYLQKHDKITMQDIFKFYSADVITLENIQELKQNQELHIEEIVSEEELIKLYQSFNKYGKSEKEFMKYLTLYKELKIKDTDFEHKEEIGQKLIEELDSDFEEKDLKKMYELGMIPVETAIEWGRRIHYSRYVQRRYFKTN